MTLITQLLHTWYVCIYIYNLAKSYGEPSPAIRGAENT